MRHQAEHIALVGEDPGDVVARAIGIGGAADCARGVAITESDQSFALDPFNGRVVGFVIALAMGDAELR